MNTYLGENVYPSGGVPELYSIGVGLGRIPRFAGHLREWYPVLCHVLVVAAILPDEYAIYGLLHDAQESCVSDVPTPWKTVAARRREEMLLKRIYAKHYPEAEFPLSDPAQSAVDLADHVALAAEANVLGHPRAKEVWPEYDEECAELVRAMHRECRQYLEPENSGPHYEQAFKYYKSRARSELTTNS